MKKLLIIIMLSIGMFSANAQLKIERKKFNVSISMNDSSISQRDIKHLFRFAKQSSNGLVSRIADYYITVRDTIYYQPGRSLKIYLVKNGNLERIKS